MPRARDTFVALSIPARLLARTDEELAPEIESVFRVPWKGYFLYFGAIEPKKNLGRIV